MEVEQSFGSPVCVNQETGLVEGYTEEEWKEQFELRKQSTKKLKKHEDDQSATK